MKIKDSITIKILVSMSVCIILFSSFGIFSASAIFGSRLTQRSIQIHEQYLSVIVNQLESDITELQKISGLISVSQRIVEALRCKNLNNVSSRRLCLDAQMELDYFSASTPMYNYLKRIAVLNEDGIRIAAFAGTDWSSVEWQALQEFILTEEARNTITPIYRWYSLLDPMKNENLSFLAPISTVPGGYLYIELDGSLLWDQLRPYENLQQVFITDDTCSRLLASWQVEDRPELIHHMLTPSGNRIPYNGKISYLSSRRVSQFGLRIACLTDTGTGARDNSYVFYVLLILFFTTTVVGILVTRLLTQRITRPIQVLTRHIRTISKTNNFSANPEIECSSDEIGEIGRAVNHMTDHIQSLLKTQAQMYEQQKNIEISLLQSQINPHFLYNTLDSIRWMAVIQGSKNIEQTTHALEHLLRNMAKGVGDKISLRDELALVGDYIHIQQVRYVEIFDYFCHVPEELMDCRIIKLTLQPIVENAILHGIEPMGEFGEIEISAYEKDNDLYITIEDNGMGMTEEELEKLTRSMSNKDKNALSGIGVSNVDARLKLHYGPSYGLIYESSPGEFTRVTIHIPKE